MTWNEYVAWLVSEHGSLAAAAQRAAGAERDAESVERALRRLRAKKNGDGGDWGRRLLRTFGLPRETADRVKWMGLYHSRFADLPLELCLDQLRAWNRPPVSESPARLWLSLGLATCALRRGELDDTERHLAEARRTTQAPDDARLELELVTAFVASKREQPVDLLRLEPLVRKVNDPDFTARWLDQRAYAGEPELYGQISETTPFSASKRHGGLAYVAWRAGHRPAPAATPKPPSLPPATEASPACASPTSACSRTSPATPPSASAPSALPGTWGTSSSSPASAELQKVLQLNHRVLDRAVRQLHVEPRPAPLEPRRRADGLEAERVLSEVHPRVVHDPRPVERRRPRDERRPLALVRRRPLREAAHRFGRRHTPLQRRRERLATRLHRVTDRLHQHLEAIDHTARARPDARTELRQRVMPVPRAARLHVHHDPQALTHGASP